MSLRILGVANALALAGAQVDVIGPSATGRADPNLLRLSEPSVDFRTYSPDASTRSRVDSRFLGDRQLSEMVISGHYAGAIGFDVSWGLLRQMKRCEPFVPRLALDVNEWYSPTLSSPLRSLQREVAMRSKVPKYASLIVISRYLEEGIIGPKHIRIPPLFDRKIRRGSSPFSNRDSELHVVFAGTVGSKDSSTVTNLLNAAHILRRKGLSITVHLVGPSANELASLPVDREAIRASEIYGRLDHQSSIGIVESSDFSILQRRENRRSLAGFPSKVVESWVVGTPVILNVIGDLALYARHGVNSVVMGSADVEATLEGLRFAAENRDIFRRDSIRDWADKYFSPSAYAEPLSKFMLEY